MGIIQQAVITKENSCEYRIYALVDVRNNNIFYIGLTTLPLEVRLSAHISTAINKSALKNRWLCLYKTVIINRLQNRDSRSVAFFNL